MTEEQRRLTQILAIYSFCADDVALYLDAYPDNAEALSYYREINALKQRTMNEYEQKYGPITLPSNPKSWEAWTRSPWPWQND